MVGREESCLVRYKNWVKYFSVKFHNVSVGQIFKFKNQFKSQLIEEVIYPEYLLEKNEPIIL